MDKMDVTIGISADASGVEAGVQRSKRSLADLGKSAKGVSDGLGSMGDGGAAAAKKIERDTRSMQNSIQRQIAVMQAGSKSSREYWDSLAGQRGISTSALKPYLDQLDQARKKADDAKQATIDFGEAMRFVQAAAAGGILMSVASQYMQLADAATNVNSRLKLVTDSTQELASAQTDLFAIAQKARVSYTGLVDTYAQMARSTKELGVSQRDMLGVTETISKAVTISGVSAASANAALVQLSQGFASGVLRGEELNSVMEQTPRLAMAIANGMGISIGKLRELGQAGELTAEKVVQALQNSAGDVAREFDQMATTVEQAITKAENSLVRLIGVIDQTTGASGVAADGIGRFARGFDTLADSIQGMAASSSLSDFFTSAFQSNENLNAELKISEAEMTKLTARLAKAPDNIYVRSQIAELQKYIAGLKEAQARLAALTGASVSGGATDPRDQSQFISRGASYANYAKQQEAARQGLLEISAKSNGVTKQFTGDLKAYEEALRTGVISANDYVKAVTELNKKRYESTEAGKAEAKAAKDGAKGNKEGESAILSYIKSLEARTAAQRLEIAQGDKLTESQRARIQLEALLADSKNKASKSQVANAQALLAESEANEAWLKNASDVEKALADMQKAREQSLQSAQDSVKKLVEEAEAAAYAETHNVSLAEAVERLALARAENAYQQAVERQEAPATLDYLRQEIEARKQLVAATAQKGVKEANAKAAEQAAKDWERVSQTIGDTLADYIMAGGKDAATYLKRLFSTLVLQPVVQTVVGGIMGTGVAGASGVASGGVGGIANLAQQAYSAFTSPMFSNFGMGLASNIQQFGGTLFTKGFESFGSSITGFGNTVAQFSDAINIAGDVFGYGSALYSLSKGNYGSALGSAVGTYFGGPVGAMLGSTLGGLLDGAFGGGTPHGGAAAGYSGGQITDFGKGFTRKQINSDYTSGMQAGVSAVAATVGQSFDALAAVLGKQGGYRVTTGFSADSDDPAWGRLQIYDAVGSALVDWNAGRYGPKDTRLKSQFSSDPKKAFDQYLQSVAASSLPALKDIAPAWADAMIDSVTQAIGFDGSSWKSITVSGQEALTAMQSVVQQIAMVEAGFTSLGNAMSMFSGLSDDMKTALLGGLGGMEGLTATAQGFYQSYYSEQERAAKTAGQMTEALKAYGVELPATTEQYRALVEQQLAAGDAGAELAAVLLGMSGTFKSVADAWATELDGMADAVAGVFDGVYSSIKDLLAEIESDRKGILRGTGVMTAAEIAAGIVGAGVLAPSMLGIISAKSAVDAAGSGVANASASNTSAQTALTNAQAKRDTANGARDSVAAQIAAANDRIAYLQWDSSQLWGGGAKSGYSLSKRKRWQAAIDVEMSSQLALRAQLEAQLQPLAQAAAQQQSAYDAVAAAAKAAAEQLASAQTALAAAQQAEVRAKAEYAAQVSQFVIDAGNSVTKLSDLRGEVVSFYEAQAQAVQAMLQSAGNLRGVVDQLRLGQLNAAQTAAELGSRYAVDYAMALSTTGSTRAGYVDAMASNLAGLSEALKAEAATGEDWRIETAKLFAQASNAAGLLEGDAESDDYQDVALGLLDSIDTALAGLSGATKTAEQVIADAVNNGTQAQLEGLRAIVAALTGGAVPAFAAGGLHTGGLRLVGERGPELEVTGPARYWNANQTQAMLGGGGNTARLEVLVEQLIEENRAQASAIVRLQQDLNRQVMRWDTQGLPREREEA